MSYDLLKSGQEAQKLFSDIISPLGLTEQFVKNLTSRPKFPPHCHIVLDKPHGLQLELSDRIKPTEYQPVFRMSISWAVPGEETLIFEHLTFDPLLQENNTPRSIRWIYKPVEHSDEKCGFVLSGLQIAPLIGEKTFSQGRHDRLITTDKTEFLHFAPRYHSIPFILNKGLLEPISTVYRTRQDLEDNGGVTVEGELETLKSRLPFTLKNTNDGTFVLSGHTDGEWCLSDFVIPGIPSCIMAQMNTLKDTYKKLQTR